jgi:hypothetical protein
MYSHRTAVQCRDKLKNLKKEYKKPTDHDRNHSGGARKTHKAETVCENITSEMYVIMYYHKNKLEGVVVDNHKLVRH